MTYCVGLYLQQGLVLLSDTRTNAGIDHISTFTKMSVFEIPGERTLVLMTAGNLAVSQAVVSTLREAVGEEDADGLGRDLMRAPTMFRAARVIGAAVREVHKADAAALKENDTAFNVSIIFGGQIKGAPPALFLVYSAGNFIQATADTPYLQIGEHKYGKPILDRALTHGTPIKDALKLALVSMDSTVRSNMSVGLPIDLAIYERDAFAFKIRRRMEAGDPYYESVRECWSNALIGAYHRVPDADFLVK